MQSQTHLHVKYFTSGCQVNVEREDPKGLQRVGKYHYPTLPQLVTGKVSWHFTL